MRDLLPKIESLPWHYALPVIVLTVSFLVLIAWVFSSSRKPEFEHAARIPLETDDHS